MVVILVLLALMAAPGVRAQEQPAGKVTFTVGIINDVDSLNPFIGILAETYEVWALMYDYLVGYSQKDFSPVPGLAESWQVSDDELTWTYKIRQGVKWSDGQPLTARDAAYTFNRIMKGTFEQTNYGNYVANIKRVTAPDDTTLVMTTKKPSPSMLRLAVPILPEHIWKNIDEKEVSTFDNEKNAVGSGAFKLEERKTGQFVRLSANKSWWGGAAKIDEVVFRVFNNADAEIQALRKGEIDFADQLDAAPFNSLKSTEGITIVPGEYSGFDELAFNTGAALDTGQPIGDGHPALKDKRVRQAIAHAIDKKALVDRVLGGYGTEATGIIPAIYKDLTFQPSETEAYTFDLAEANRLLDAAGYKDTNGDKVREMPDGSRPLRFRLFTRQESNTSQQSVQFIRGWLRDIGIATDVKVVEENRLTEIIGQGEFDMFEWGWVVEPDPDYQLSTFTCGSRSYKSGGDVTANLSDSFYCNPAYDKLYQQQKVTIDPAKRAEIVKQMQRMLYVDAPYVVTFYYDDLQAYRSDRFTGFRPQPDPGGVVLFEYGIYSYLNITTPQAAAASGDDGGSGVPLIPIAAGVAVVGAAGVLVALRRRSTQDERE
ncbi:MAG TPA: ABC transporter substrate-binding protein [Actinomycetota bacterium]|nr:ABC transporter substrate-binding protein [Actinomycetota bacterium]